jgi:hypothetical protein
LRLWLMLRSPPHQHPGTNLLWPGSSPGVSVNGTVWHCTRISHTGTAHLVCDSPISTNSLVGGPVAFAPASPCVLHFWDDAARSRKARSSGRPCSLPCVSPAANPAARTSGSHELHLLGRGLNKMLRCGIAVGSASSYILRMQQSEIVIRAAGCPGTIRSTGSSRLSAMSTALSELETSW